MTGALLILVGLIALMVVLAFALRKPEGSSDWEEQRSRQQILRELDEMEMHRSEYLVDWPDEKEET